MHKINKKPIRSFSASIAAFDYQPMQISNTYTDSMVPILIKRDMKPKRYDLVMDFISQMMDMCIRVILMVYHQCSRKEYAASRLLFLCWCCREERNVVLP